MSTSHLLTFDFYKEGIHGLVLPRLFSKVLDQLSLREAGQISHILYGQSFCDGGTQLTPQVPAARVKYR